jgi:hypothetical protein
MHEHGYSLHEIDGLLPWEKEIYLNMVMERLKEKKESMEKHRRT